jgi:hypothetical protein
MRVKVITVMTPTNAESLGDEMTKKADEWIDANKKEIYSIASIKTKLDGSCGMVTIVYSRCGKSV